VDLAGHGEAQRPDRRNQALATVAKAIGATRDKAKGVVVVEMRGEALAAKVCAHELHAAECRSEAPALDAIFVRCAAGIRSERGHGIRAVARKNV
jgi:hypothetical protein